jgi:Fibronectin type III-like domain
MAPMCTTSPDAIAFPVKKNARKPMSQSFLRARISGFAAILLVFAVAASAQAPVLSSPAIEAKAHAMLAKLTLEQKIELIGGVEVAQLYVSDPSAKASRPELELKGFEKDRLAPGETRHVTLSLDARAFSYWDEAAHEWTIDPGKFTIVVGDSSENTPLHEDLTLN